MALLFIPVLFVFLFVFFCVVLSCGFLWVFWGGGLFCFVCCFFSLFLDMVSSMFQKLSLKSL